MPATVAHTRCGHSFFFCELSSFLPAFLPRGCFYLLHSVAHLPRHVARKCRNTFFLYVDRALFSFVMFVYDTCWQCGQLGSRGFMWRTRGFSQFRVLSEIHCPCVKPCSFMSCLLLLHQRVVLSFFVVTLV